MTVGLGSVAVNPHLLRWLSFIPLLTEWIGDHYDNTTPPAEAYAVICPGSAVAFTILTVAIIRATATPLNRPSVLASLSLGRGNGLPPEARPRRRA